jgi:hypothetical protein
MVHRLPTNLLLDMCRFGVSLQNEAVDTAAREVVSWIVFDSLLKSETEVSDELYKRVKILEDAQAKPLKYPKDMEDEEGDPEQVDDPTLPEDDPGPMVA